MGILANRAVMSVASAPGTGPVSLGSAVAGYQTFAAAGITDQQVVSYTIADGSNFECGQGTYGASGTTLTRTTIVASSAGSNNPITATANATVFISPLASDLAPAPIVSKITSTVGSVTMSLPSGYSQYEIIISNLAATAAGIVLMRLSTNGTSMDSTSGHYLEQVFEDYATNNSTNYRSSDTGFYLGNPQANGAATIRLMLYSYPIGYSQILAQYAFNDGTNQRSGFLYGAFVPAGALTAIQVSNAGGNLTAGAIISVRSIA